MSDLSQTLWSTRKSQLSLTNPQRCQSRTTFLFSPRLNFCRSSLVAFSRSIAAVVAKLFAIRTVYVGTLEQCIQPRAVSIRRATLSFFQTTVSPSIIRSKTKRTTMNRWDWWFHRTTARHRREECLRHRSPTSPMISIELHRETSAPSLTWLNSFCNTNQRLLLHVNLYRTVFLPSSSSFCRMAFLFRSALSTPAHPQWLSFFFSQSYSYWSQVEHGMPVIILSNSSLIVWQRIRFEQCLQQMFSHLSLFRCVAKRKNERTNETVTKEDMRHHRLVFGCFLPSRSFLCPLLLSIRSSLDIFLFLSVMLLRVLLYLIYANCVFLLSFIFSSHS